MREAKIQLACRTWWHAHGGVSVKFRPDGEVGFPDCIFISPHGKTVFVEFKQPEGRTSARQRYWLWKLATLGHIVWLIDDKAQFQALSKRILAKA